MAKNTCAICGAEVNLVTGQKLADGNYICRKNCRKKLFKCFDVVASTLPEVTAHIAQVEKGTKIWKEVLVSLKKAKKNDGKLKCFGVGNPLLYVSTTTGLVALVEAHYKFMMFGKSETACVYRIADLIQYDYEEEQVKGSDGKTEKKEFCVLGFKDTEGMAFFRMEVATQKAYQEMAKYFDTLFGIQKTLGNSFKNAKRQLDAIKAAAGAVKGAVDGTLTEAQAAETAGTVDAYVHGDRTEWIEKADAALAPYKQ